MMKKATAEQQQEHAERESSDHRTASKEQYPISETRFWIQRLSKTGVRALHILGIAGSAGGILYGVERELWLNWWVLAMVTGVILMTLEISRSKLWLIQLKGVLTLVKLMLLASFFIIPQHKPMLFITVLLMSVFIAHGPSGLRHYSIWHRRRIDEKQGKKKR
jgi:membrane-bound ClpP family serine protease